MGEIYNTTTQTAREETTGEQEKENDGGVVRENTGEGDDLTTVRTNDDGETSIGIYDVTESTFVGVGDVQSSDTTDTTDTADTPDTTEETGTISHSPVKTNQSSTPPPTSPSSPSPSTPPQQIHYSVTVQGRSAVEESRTTLIYFNATTTETSYTSEDNIKDEETVTELPEIGDNVEDSSASITYATHVPSLSPQDVITTTPSHLGSVIIPATGDEGVTEGGSVAEGVRGSVTEGVGGNENEGEGSDTSTSVPLIDHSIDTVTQANGKVTQNTLHVTKDTSDDTTDSFDDTTNSVDDTTDPVDDRSEVTTAALDATNSEKYVTMDTVDITMDTVGVTMDTASVTKDTAGVTMATVDVTMDTVDVTMDTAGVTMDTWDVTTDTVDVTTYTVDITTDTMDVTTDTVDVTMDTAEVTRTQVVTVDTINNTTHPDTENDTILPDTDKNTVLPGTSATTNDDDEVVTSDSWRESTRNADEQTTVVDPSATSDEQEENTTAGLVLPPSPAPTFPTKPIIVTPHTTPERKTQYTKPFTGPVTTNYFSSTTVAAGGGGEGDLITPRGKDEDGSSTIVHTTPRDQTPSPSSEPLITTGQVTLSPTSAPRPVTPRDRPTTPSNETPKQEVSPSQSSPDSTGAVTVVPPRLTTGPVVVPGGGTSREPSPLSSTIGPSVPFSSPSLPRTTGVVVISSPPTTPHTILQTTITPTQSPPSPPPWPQTPGIVIPSSVSTTPSLQVPTTPPEITPDLLTTRLQERSTITQTTTSWISVTGGGIGGDVSTVPLVSSSSSSLSSSSSSSSSATSKPTTKVPRATTPRDSFSSPSSSAATPSSSLPPGIALSSTAATTTAMLNVSSVPLAGDGEAGGVQLWVILTGAAVGIAALAILCLCVFLFVVCRKRKRSDGEGNKEHGGDLWASSSHNYNVSAMNEYTYVDMGTLNSQNNATGGGFPQPFIPGSDGSKMETVFNDDFGYDIIEDDAKWKNIWLSDSKQQLDLEGKNTVEDGDGAVIGMDYSQGISTFRSPSSKKTSPNKASSSDSPAVTAKHSASLTSAKHEYAVPIITPKHSAASSLDSLHEPPPPPRHYPNSAGHPSEPMPETAELNFPAIEPPTSIKPLLKSQKPQRSPAKRSSKHLSAERKKRLSEAAATGDVPQYMPVTVIYNEKTKDQLI